MTATVVVPMDRPAPTITGKSGGQWVLRNGARANASGFRGQWRYPVVADAGHHRYG